MVMVSKPWRIALWIVAGLVGLGFVFLGGRWLYGFTTDASITQIERDAAVQVTQAGIAALALVATIYAAIAASRSSASAKASEQMVERARLALGYHNRPSGELTFETPQARHRWENRPTGTTLSVEEYVHVGDNAIVTVELRTETGARMTNIRLMYITTDGRTHEVLLTNGHPSGELEGVLVIGHKHAGPFPLPPLAYSVQRITLDCFDPETATTWRASASAPERVWVALKTDGTVYRKSLTFERVA